MQPTELQSSQPHQADLQPDHQEPEADPRTRLYSWDDPAKSAAAARAMDGMSFLEALAAGRLPAAPVARTLDFAPVSVQPGTVIFAFLPAEFHYNPIGSVHGGESCPPSATRPAAVRSRACCRPGLTTPAWTSVLSSSGK